MLKSLNAFVFLILLATSALASNSGSDSEERVIEYSNDGSSGSYSNSTTYSCRVEGAIRYLNREASGSNRILSRKVKVFRTETIQNARIKSQNDGVRYYSRTGKMVPQGSDLIANLPTGSILIQVGEKPTDVVTINCGHGMVASQ